MIIAQLKNYELKSFLTAEICYVLMHLEAIA